MDNIIEHIKSVFNVLSVKKQREDLVFIKLAKEQLIPAITYLRDIEGFSHLVMISVVDWLEDNIFELNYIVHNHEHHIDISFSKAGVKFLR